MRRRLLALGAAVVVAAASLAGLAQAARLTDHQLAAATVLLSVLGLGAACTAIGLAWQTVSESQVAGRTLKEAAALLDQSTALLQDLLSSAAAARRKDHSRARVNHLPELEQAFIIRLQGAEQALATQGPSERWVEGELKMTVALAAFNDSEMDATRDSMNVNHPDTFLDHRPAVTEEISGALAAANRELLIFTREHAQLLGREPGV